MVKILFVTYLLVPFSFISMVQAAEGDRIESTEIVLNGEMNAVQDECEIQEGRTFNSKSATLLNEKPSPVCKPFILSNGTKFSHPFLSATFTVFIGDLISAMTQFIDISTFEGTMAPLPGHANQSDMSNFSFMLKDIQAQSVSAPGMNGQTLSINGDIMVGTTIYREAHVLHYLGGKRLDVTDPELKLAVRVAANVARSETLLGYISDGVVADCIEKVKKDRQMPSLSSFEQAMLDVREKTCSSLNSSKITGSPSEKAFEMLASWKKALLNEIDSFHETDPGIFISPKCAEIKAIASDRSLGPKVTEFEKVIPLYCNDSYEDIVNVISDGIQISTSDGKANLNIEISGINRKLEDRFPDFFENFKLDVISVNSFSASIGNESSDLVFDVAILQPYGRTHSLITKINEDISGVRTPEEATAVGKVLGMGVIAIFGAKLPSLFKYRSTSSAAWDVVRSGGTQAAVGLAASVVSDKIKAAKESVLERGREITDFLNLGNADEE